MTIQQLVLIGTGPANLRTLLDWCDHPRADTDLTLITPHECVFHPPMLPGLLAGHHDVSACSVPLHDLLAGARARLMVANVLKIDTEERVLDTMQGAVRYSTLSIDLPATSQRDAIEAAMPGARANALFTLPLEGLAKLLPQFIQHASSNALRVAVIAYDADCGVSSAELAMALRHRLPHCHVSLLHSGLQCANSGAESLLRRILKEHGITALQDTCVGIEADSIRLQSGASLLCSAAIVHSSGTTAPPWYESNRLAAHAPERPAVQWIDCGNRRAIASFQAWSVSGRLVWQLKTVRERRQFRPYLQAAQNRSAKSASHPEPESNIAEST